MTALSSRQVATTQTQTADAHDSLSSFLSTDPWQWKDARGNVWYRHRESHVPSPHFEMYTLTIDPPDRHDEALKVLKKEHVSCTNYIFDSDDRDKLAESLPYTVLIPPGGKIVRRWKDEFDPAQLKSEISTLLGKTYVSPK